MAKTNRFTISYAVDGSTMAISAGTCPPEVVPLAAMPSAARRHCFEFGLTTLVRNTVAGAEKAGWTDAQCHGYMARKAKMIVAGKFKASDGAEDFHDFVTAVVEAKNGNPRDAAQRTAVETALLRIDGARRDEIRAGPRAPIAKARWERLAEAAAGGVDLGILEGL